MSTGQVQGVGFRAATRRRALDLGLRGWVANAEDASVRIHAEGPEAALEQLRAFLASGPSAAQVTDLDVRTVADEGHEQFAVRGVSAGLFVIQRHQARSLHYDLRLEVEGVLRSWALPKEPSMDPAVRRLAVEQPDHALGHAEHVSETVALWDRGHYEQGGRVPWPEALARGHAVFVLHGSRLRGGFALQRTHSRAEPGGRPAQWLLIKRRERPLD